MFPVTISVQNMAQLSAVMAALSSDALAAKPIKEAPHHLPEPEAPAKQTKKAEEKKPEAQPTQADLGKTAAQATEALDGHANKPDSAATYDDVKAAVLRLSKEKGRDVAVQVLQRCGVQKAPDLQPEQYADFVRIATEVLEGAQP